MRRVTVYETQTYDLSCKFTTTTKTTDARARYVTYCSLAARRGNRNVLVAAGPRSKDHRGKNGPDEKIPTAAFDGAMRIDWVPGRRFIQSADSEKATGFQKNSTHKS